MAGGAGHRAACNQQERAISTARWTSVSDGLAAFSICLNLAASEFHVRRRVRLARPARLTPARLSSWFPVTGPNRLVYVVTLAASLWWPPRVWPVGCAHVEARPARPTRTARSIGCATPAAACGRAIPRAPPSAAPGLGGPSVPLPQYAIEPAQAMFRFGPTHRGRSPFVLPAVKPVGLVDIRDRRAHRLVTRCGDRRLGPGGIAGRQAVQRRA